MLAGRGLTSLDGAMPPPIETVCLLDAFPDLARTLPPGELERARGELMVPVVERKPGPWIHPIEAAVDPLALGIFVIEGMLARNTTLGETTSTELVGRGDVLRPTDYAGEGAPIPMTVGWVVLEPTRIAVLDREVTGSVCRWPALVTAIVAAAVQRAWGVAQMMAVSHLRRVDARLLALFWYLADRFGHVEREGVVVPVRLTHETLGHVVGAQRPSVTTAINQLEAAGRLSRRAAGGWVLHGEPPSDLAQMQEAEPPAASR